VRWRWLALALVLGLVGCDGDLVPARLPEIPPAPLGKGGEGEPEERRVVFWRHDE